MSKRPKPIPATPDPPAPRGITITPDADADAAGYGVERRAPSPPATWNGIARAWFTRGPSGDLVRLDPQPPPPSGVMQTAWGPMPYVTQSIPLEPAVKVSA